MLRAFVHSAVGAVTALVASAALGWGSQRAEAFSCQGTYWIASLPGMNATFPLNATCAQQVFSADLGRGVRIFVVGTTGDFRTYRDWKRYVRRIAPGLEQ